MKSMPFTFSYVRAINATALALVSLVVSNGGFAEEVIDQMGPGTNLNLNMGTPGLVWQQEVTAGISGKLTGVDVFFYVFPGETEVALYHGEGWQVGPPVFIQTFSHMAIADWQRFDFTEETRVTAGEKFILQFEAIDFPGTTNALGSEGFYPAGDLYLNAELREELDFGFRTYVREIRFADVNLDGAVDLTDVQPFVQLIASSGYLEEADLNCDGLVNLLDVPLFVEAVVGA